MTTTRIVAVAGSLGMVGLAAILYVNFGAFLPWRENTEARRLAATTGLQTGWTVADIGAGTGRFTVAMARTVGRAGRVYSTEISAENRDAIRARVAAADLANVIVVGAERLRTNLPDACCDLVLLRAVYHHAADPKAFAESLRSAVRPGGRLAVIDFEPGALWFHRRRQAGTSARRPGHGVSRADAIAELTRAGFHVEREVRDWSGPLWLVLLTR